MFVTCPVRAAAILRDKAWRRGGFIWKAVRSAVGHGPLTSEGEAHQRQRELLGRRLSDFAVSISREKIAAWTFPDGPFDLSRVMIEHVERLIVPDLLGLQPGAAQHIRGLVGSIPWRALGLPIGGGHLRSLEALVSAAGGPDWLAGCTPEERRDMILSLYVASVETTAAALTWTFCGKPEELPIWMLPRQHAETGETAFLKLSPALRYGVGVHKCVGARLADTIVRLAQEHHSFEVLPQSNLRPRLGLTRWPRLAWVRYRGNL